MNGPIGAGTATICRLGDNRLPPRFWSKIAVNPESGCWLWTAGKSNRGYGRYHHTRMPKWQYAHRVAYTELAGDIPAGLQLDHLCRIRSCVNPAHLEPVTAQENLLRGRDAVNPQGRKFCPHGHEFTEANTLIRDKPVNHRGRECRTCRGSRRNISRQSPAGTAALVAGGER